MMIGRTRAAWHRDRKIRLRKDDQCLDAAMPTSRGNGIARTNNDGHAAAVACAVSQPMVRFDVSA
jgi:hypothetical protein